VIPQQIETEFHKRLMPRIFPVHAALPALRENGASVVLLTTDAGRYATPGESVLGRRRRERHYYDEGPGQGIKPLPDPVQQHRAGLTEGTPT
jgi:hypothetical protein